jgi:probable phosphomutase (TIGR03848 family)
MPTLLLIRHGENEYLKKGILIGNMPGVHLNNRGREQAAALGESLKGLPIKAIYSSPLERAIETATPPANHLGLEILVRPALMDTNVGEWAGRKLKDLRRLTAWKQVQERPSGFRFPGGDSFVELQERLVGTIDSIAATHKKNDLLAVFFHADPIKLVLAHHLGMPLDNFQKMSVDTGSVTILEIDGPEARLVALNLKPLFVLNQ